ncbi:MAG: thiamine phosphate synthase [Myxococcales bacterium]|nr:thiamine phosphate synthase [Myxococcales bacterium]
MLALRPGLYAIVDPERCAGRPALEIATAILRGGAAALQLRAKGLGDRERLALARAMGNLSRAHGVPMILNDRVDLARLCGADGVHLGQDDLEPRHARQLLGAEAWIGLSTHSLEQVQSANGCDLQMIGFGPIFATGSKPDADPVVGLEGLRSAVQASRVPVVAIGGVELEQARAIHEAGALMGAAIGALGLAPDPEAAARALHRRLGGR